MPDNRTLSGGEAPAQEHEYRRERMQAPGSGHGHGHDHSHDQSHDHEGGHGHDGGHGHVHSHTQTQAVKNRLARAAGHLEKVRRMVDEGADCAEVLVQLAAVRAALNNTAKVILKDHIEHCVVDAAVHGDQAVIDDLNKAIERFLE